MTEKFVRKYMRLAKLIGEDQNPCYSRNIGVVIVDPTANRILGTGYNGPPRGTTHCDDPKYLEEIVWPQLTDSEKMMALKTCGIESSGEETSDSDNKQLFLTKAAYCKQCPRKLVGAASGKRLELCSCAHGETNAIVNAGQSVVGAWMFCWCGVPCYECTKLIINAGIREVYCLKVEPDYSHGSRILFQQAWIRLHISPPEYYLT